MHFCNGSVYFTKNSGYRSLKNRSCVTVFGSCSVILTVGEPLGDVSGSASQDFRTLVTGISGEIDASFCNRFVWKRGMYKQLVRDRVDIVFF